jgi:hypothetical protein
MPTPAHLREQSRLYCRASKEDSTLQIAAKSRRARVVAGKKSWSYAR